TNGDLLFYGCDANSSDAGKTLLDGIAALTGDDVAASPDTMPSLAQPQATPTAAPAANPAAAPTASTARDVDVVLIDSNLTDSNLLAQAAQPGSQVFVYDGSTMSTHDALSQVIAWAGTTGNHIHSLSIMSHGTAGAFEMGNEWVTTSTLDQNASDW